MCMHLHYIKYILVTYDLRVKQKYALVSLSNRVPHNLDTNAKKCHVS